MPRGSEFEIYVDSSCLSEPMDDENNAADAVDQDMAGGSDTQERDTVEQSDMVEHEVTAGENLADDEEETAAPDAEFNDCEQQAEDVEENLEEAVGSQIGESSSSDICSSTPQPPRPASGGDDSSSHHEGDDDVFSDRSARSSIDSLGSAVHRDDPAAEAIKYAESQDQYQDQDQDQQDRRDSFRSSLSQSGRRSPRVSGVSIISGLSQYEKEEQQQFAHHLYATPGSGGAPRPAFRSPSSVRALQMSSPPPSVIGGSGATSPRSSSTSRRQTGASIHSHGGGGSNGNPFTPRIGSPAQYSPKGRATPPRFRTPREPAPLVLLHVTLMPLRWPWGDALDALDLGAETPEAEGEEDGKQVSPAARKQSLRTLRDAWRQLRDRVGDTVLERGVLLPHPQGDYEVLEERLLEALELPVRRRARILQCGHYLGPSNVMEAREVGDDDGDEDDLASRSGAGSRQRRRRRRTDDSRLTAAMDEEGEEDEEGERHWCSTCMHDIRFESLGAARVFSVKVYASNGLIRAGAWAACWKEMERVDVEIEPLVPQEPGLHAELEKSAAGTRSQLRERGPEREQEDENEEEERHRQLHDEEGHREQEQRHDDQEQEQDDLPHAEPLRTDFQSEHEASPFLSQNDREMEQSRVTSSPPSSSQPTFPLHASPAEPPLPSSPPRVASSRRSHSRATTVHTEPIDTSEARRRRDEERMREIYGDTPPSPPPPSSSPPPSHYGSERDPRASDIPYRNSSPPPVPSTPGSRSPSEAVFERRRAQQQQQQPCYNGSSGGGNRGNHGGSEYQSASLGQLLLESAKVLLRDPKNVAIAILVLFVAVMLLRPGALQTNTAPEVAYHHASPAKAYQNANAVVNGAYDDRDIINNHDTIAANMADARSSTESTTTMAISTSVVTVSVQAASAIAAEHETGPCKLNPPAPPVAAAAAAAAAGPPAAFVDAAAAPPAQHPHPHPHQYPHSHPYPHPYSYSPAPPIVANHHHHHVYPPPAHDDYDDYRAQTHNHVPQQPPAAAAAAVMHQQHQQLPPIIERQVVRIYETVTETVQVGVGVATASSPAPPELVANHLSSLETIWQTQTQTVTVTAPEQCPTSSAGSSSSSSIFYPLGGGDDGGVLSADAEMGNSLASSAAEEAGKEDDDDIVHDEI